MKQLFGFLVVGLMGAFIGCGEDTPTGPQGQTLEVETTRWDDGNIKVEFQYYRDGGSVVKHGFYKEYYQNGQVEVKGNLVDGKREGKVVRYYESGRVKLEKNHVNNLLNGKFVEYYENGIIKDEDIYKDSECVRKCEGDE